MQICAVSDLFEAGITEDGEKRIGLVWYVIAELENGRRFAHVHRFYSTVAEFEGELGCMVFPDYSQEAEQGAKALEVRISECVSNGGKLDSRYWYEVDPRYGSDAYSDLDQTGYFKRREMMEG